MAVPPSCPASGRADMESGGQALDNCGAFKEQTSVSGKNRCWTAAQYKGTAEEAYPLQFGFQKVGFVFSGRDAGQTKKARRPEPEGLSASLSERRIAGLGTRFGGRRRERRFRFRTAELPHGVGANAPEDGDLRGLGLLGLAVLAVVL
jgi:hypothetical protein